MDEVWIITLSAPTKNEAEELALKENNGIAVLSTVEITRVWEVCIVKKVKIEEVVSKRNKKSRPV
jgi:hypothetical protein